MIRGSLAANAAYAFMIVSATKGSAIQYRATSGGTAANTTRSWTPVGTQISRKPQAASLSLEAQARG